MGLLEMPGGMIVLAAMVGLALLATAAQAQDGPGDKPVISDPSAMPCGTDCYSQGGVVVDGVAYFTADHSF